jgi:hypothetical protein
MSSVFEKYFWGYNGILARHPIILFCEEIIIFSVFRLQSVTQITQMLQDDHRYNNLCKSLFPISKPSRSQRP